MGNKICILLLSILLTASFPALSASAEELKGKVIMVKGKDVTIRLEEQGYVNQNDSIEISYDAGGTPIPYGTWRVTAVKDDGTIEAEPVEVEDQPPTIDLDAVVHATGTKPVSEAEKLFSQAMEYYYGTQRHIPAEDIGNQKEQNSTRNRIDKAIELYHRSSEKGHAQAGYYLGAIYQEGLHRSNPDGRNKEEREKDLAMALKWYLVSAERGYFQAQSQVGWFYLFGLGGVRPDIVEAEKWYRRADENRPLHPVPEYRIYKRYLYEFAHSLYRLAVLQDTMTKQKEVEQKAIELYREAARGGNEQAQEQLREKGLKW